MEKQKLQSREKHLANQLFDQLTQTGYEPTRTSVEESGLYDVVTVELDGIGIGGDYALCHMFFLPSMEDDMPVHNFSVTMNITDTIEGDDRKISVMQAITYLNFIVPIGAFVLDPELNVLSYRRNTAIPVDLSEEETLGLMGREFFNSTATITPFISALVCLRNGEIELPEFAEAIRLVLDAKKPEA